MVSISPPWQTQLIASGTHFLYRASGGGALFPWRPRRLPLQRGLGRQAPDEMGMARGVPAPDRPTRRSAGHALRGRGSRRRRAQSLGDLWTHTCTAIIIIMVFLDEMTTLFTYAVLLVASEYTCTRASSATEARRLQLKNTQHPTTS